MSLLVSVINTSWKQSEKSMSSCRLTECRVWTEETLVIHYRTRMKTPTHTNSTATVPCSRWVTTMNISRCSSSQRWQPLARHHWFTSIQSVALPEHATKRVQLDGTVRLINEHLSTLQHYLLYRAVSVSFTNTALHSLTSSRYSPTRL